MIVFENIEITQDKHLVFNVYSDNNNVAISKIEITTQNYYGKTNDFKYSFNYSTAINNIDLTTVQMTKTTTTDGTSTVENKSFDLTTDLIIVTAIPQSEEENIQVAVADCCDKKPAIGIAYYKYCIFKKSFNLLKDCGDSCEIPKDLINFILQYRALDLAIAVGDVELAIKYWNKFFNKESKITNIKTCGCHG